MLFPLQNQPTRVTSKLKAILKIVRTRIVGELRKKLISKSLFLILFDRFIGHFIGKKIYFLYPNLGLGQSNEMKVLKYLKKTARIEGEIFLDVGACYGGYSLWLSENFRRVIAFEPEKNNFRALRLIVKLFGKRNVEISEMAISNRDGMSKLFIGNTAYTHSIKSKHANNPKRFQVVKSISLNNFVKEPVGLVKVDVQGAAFDVLMGATLVMEKIKRWIIELEIDELDRKKELENLLKSFGYNLVWLSNQHIFAWV